MSMSKIACMFLLAACLALGATANEKPQRRTSDTAISHGPEYLEITGVSVVTIGIPYGFKCFAPCNPSCLYTWTHNEQVWHGSQLDIIFKTIAPSEVLTCEAQNPVTGETTSKNLTLPVAAGPQNVSIQAPTMLVSGTKSTFVCFAICYPSCIYNWYIGEQTWKTITNKLYFTTPAGTSSERVICEAQNTLSGLFASSTIKLWVAEGPNFMQITGQSSVTVGEVVMYSCYVECKPSCNITWHFQGKILGGEILFLPILKLSKATLENRLVIHIEQYHRTEPLECIAVNTVSGKTENVTKILDVTNPISVRNSTFTPPIAFGSYSLQCVGAQRDAYIQWTKNGEALSTSDRVHLTDNNVTLLFDSLYSSDSGTYQCIATEHSKKIPGISYELQVVFGPWSPEITDTGNRSVGQTTYLLPGSSDTFSCSAKCYPPCDYVWYINGEFKAENSSFTISSASVDDEGELTCAPVNQFLKNYTTVTTAIELIGGPKDVAVSGPNSVQVGEKATFECSAICTPPCVYTWDVYGRTLHGYKIDLTISRYVATESLTCTAQNTVTGKLAVANETLDVTDPAWCGC